MVCSIHPNRQAAGTCVTCGQPFCEECLVEVSDIYYCKEHVANLVKPNHIYPQHFHQNNRGYYQNPPPHDVYPQYNTNNYYPQYDYYPHRSRTVALLLCIFLGIGGFHRFYAGKIGTGILWLVTGGMFFIGWIVDIISIASGSFTDSNGYPLM